MPDNSLHAQALSSVEQAITIAEGFAKKTAVEKANILNTVKRLSQNMGMPMGDLDDLTSNQSTPTPGANHQAYKIKAKKQHAQDPDIEEKLELARVLAAMIHILIMSLSSLSANEREAAKDQVALLQAKIRDIIPEVEASDEAVEQLNTLGSENNSSTTTEPIALTDESEEQLPPGAIQLSTDTTETAKAQYSVFLQTGDTAHVSLDQGKNRIWIFDPNGKSLDYQVVLAKSFIDMALIANAGNTLHSPHPQFREVVKQQMLLLGFTCDTPAPHDKNLNEPSLNLAAIRHKVWVYYQALYPQCWDNAGQPITATLQSEYLKSLVLPLSPQQAEIIRQALVNADISLLSAYNPEQNPLAETMKRSLYGHNEATVKQAADNLLNNGPILYTFGKQAQSLSAQISTNPTTENIAKIGQAYAEALEAQISPKNTTQNTVKNKIE